MALRIIPPHRRGAYPPDADPILIAGRVRRPQPVSGGTALPVLDDGGGFALIWGAAFMGAVRLRVPPASGLQCEEVDEVLVRHHSDAGVAVGGAAGVCRFTTRTVPCGRFFSRRAGQRSNPR